MGVSKNRRHKVVLYSYLSATENELFFSFVAGAHTMVVHTHRSPRVAYCDIRESNILAKHMGAHSATRYSRLLTFATITCVPLMEAGACAFIVQ